MKFLLLASLLLAISCKSQPVSNQELLERRQQAKSRN